MRGKLRRALTTKIARKRAAGQEDEATLWQDMLDASLRDASLPDVNMVRVAMTRQIGLKWKAKATGRSDDHEAPLLTRDLQEAAFSSLLEKDKAQGPPDAPGAQTSLERVGTGRVMGSEVPGSARAVLVCCDRALAHPLTPSAPQRAPSRRGPRSARWAAPTLTC